MTVGFWGGGEGVLKCYCDFYGDFLLRKDALRNMCMAPNDGE